MQWLWKAAALGDGWESGRRAVGFQMKGPAVWSWTLDRPGHSVPLLHFLWLLPQASPPLGPLRFPLTPNHGQGLPLPPDFLILSFPGRNATAPFSPRPPAPPTHILPQLGLSQYPNWSRPWVGEAQNMLASGQSGWKVPPSAPGLSSFVSSFSSSDRGAGGGEGCLPGEQMCRSP